MLMTPSSLELRGPRHLMKCLAALEIDPMQTKVHHLWLDDDYRVLSHTESAEIVDDASHVIVVVVDSEHSWTAPRAEHRLEILNALAESIHVLDILYIHHDHWRSLLCADDDCCPDQGHAINNGGIQPHRAALFAAWQSWLISGGIPLASRHQAVHSLRDLALRDALLALMVTKSETLAAWPRLEMDEALAMSAAYLSVKASAAYLSGERDEATKCLAAAQRLEPDYSLARLLRQALDSDAPAAIVISAFSKYTPEELLSRATHDIDLGNEQELRIQDS